MTNAFFSSDNGFSYSPPSLSLKATISAVIAAEPGFEVAEVRISVSGGYVVLEGYVSEPDQIGKVFDIAEKLAGEGRVKNFLFYRR